MTNREVCEIFQEIAEILEILGENPFKSRAYRNAARVLENTNLDLQDLVRDGRLEEVPGIGSALAAKIGELVTTGRLAYYEDLKQQAPRDLLEMLKIPGVGAKTVQVFLHHDITSLQELEAAARNQRLRELPGIGKKTEEEILHGLAALKERQKRWLLSVATMAVKEIGGYLAGLDKVARVEAAGSYRRGRETVGDLDFVVASDDAPAVIARFIDAPWVREVVAEGGLKATVITVWGIQADLYVVAPPLFASTWHHFTGSKEHNVALRERARQHGWKISEYGIVKQAVGPEASGDPPGDKHGAGNGAPSLENAGDGGNPPRRERKGELEGSDEASANQDLPSGSSLLTTHCPATEEEFFQLIGLSYIPPELREDRGEIGAAERGELPILVEVGDIEGDLHVHSRASDGVNTLEELAEAARARGYRYLAVTDHSRSLAFTNGLTESRLTEQREEIDRLNREFQNFRLLAGTEVDILSDGRLDFDDRVLSQLDVVVASVHSGFRQDQETLNRRFEAALKNEHVDIIGHPTGRLIGRRDAYALDVGRVLELAADTGTALEINANPDRLDLSDTYVRQGRDLGVRFAVDTDAHQVNSLEEIRYGVLTARRGWAQRQDVINTWPLDELEKWLRGHGR